MTENTLCQQNVNIFVDMSTFPEGRDSWEDIICENVVRSVAYAVPTGLEKVSVAPLDMSTNMLTCQHFVNILIKSHCPSITHKNLNV